VRGRYGPLACKSVATAVGDNKQQIMRWPMAMDEPFVEYERDFGAKRVDHRQGATRLKTSRRPTPWLGISDSKCAGRPARSSR
jgi:hypothetical protein